MNAEGIGFRVLGLASVRDVRITGCYGAKGSKIWVWGVAVHTGILFMEEAGTRRKLACCLPLVSCG